ncbi:hypothetical protein [Planococcus sp. CAU13]|uniref:hypothetical protein n=1 Tax=Planococcus sp. CAU13 TaxID=1541197 RepID=UPI00052FE97D|nr:hypothetical protein [Planococcus sp. CAU13]
MKKYFSFAFIILFASILCIFPQWVKAEADITIDVEAGFQNKVKYNRGVPLTITATNSGTAFSGDLIIDYSESYNIGSGLAVPLDLATGESKTYRLSLPGMMDNRYSGGTVAQTIFLYEGGWDDGRAIKFTGSKSIQPNYYNAEVLFVGALTENADRLRGLGEVLPAGGADAEVFYFNQQDGMALPSDALALDSLDYLIIDEFPYSDLPADTQEAVAAWLEQGGNIIIGANSNLEASMGNLADLLPMKLSSQGEIPVSGFENPIPVFQSEIKEGAQVLLGEQDKILAAAATAGSGTIIQTAFSLGDEPVVTQQGYGEFLLALLGDVPAAASIQQDQSIKERMSYEMGMTNELFESFAVSKTAMFFIILLYIILAVPVLYVVLTKKDKREFAWIAIPVFAVLASIGIFAAGAKDRIANPQIQQTGFFEVDDDGGLTGYYMNTLLSNRGGDYRFTAPPTTTMTATAGDQFAGGNLHNNAILEKGAGSSTLTVLDMRYWSVASFIGQSYISGSGNFDIQLAVEDGILNGTIRNSFPFAVRDAAIWTGTRLLSLGDFNPGEEKQVAEPLQSDLLQPISPIGQILGYQPMTTKEELVEARKQSALALSYEHLKGNASTPYLIAYSGDALVPVSLENQDAKVSAVHLLAQSFEPAVTFEGEIRIDTENFDVDIQAADPRGFIHEYPDNPGFYGLEPGEYMVQYQLPDALTEAEADWTGLSIQTAATDVELSIFRTDTGEFEALPAGSTDLTDNSGNYISDDGKIEIRIFNNAQTGYSEVTLPEIVLEGVVNQ